MESITTSKEIQNYLKLVVALLQSAYTDGYVECCKFTASPEFALYCECLNMNPANVRNNILDKAKKFEAAQLNLLDSPKRITKKTSDNFNNLCDTLGNQSQLLFPFDLDPKNILETNSKNKNLK